MIILWIGFGCAAAAAFILVAIVPFLLRDFLRAQKRLRESGTRLSEATKALADLTEKMTEGPR